MNRLAVSLAGLDFKNPIIPASGTFGFGEPFLDFYDINILGSMSTKGTTVMPRDGNPSPRIAECSAGLLNAVGLQNPGIDEVVRGVLPKVASYFDGFVIQNVSGYAVEEFVECCEKLDAVPNVGIIEVNISCPNVHGGGMAFGTSPEAAAAVTAACKKVTSKPIFIKLSPNVTDIASIAKACEDAGADGLTLINTLLGMRIDTKARKPVLANVTGGFSGPAVFPIAVRMVYQVAKAVQIPIIGLGGIETADNVIEMMMAGASAVQVGSANLRNPYACKELIETLPKAMDELGIAQLSDIIGII